VDADLTLKIAAFVAAPAVALIGGYSVMRRQVIENEKSNTALAEKFDKLVALLRSEDKDSELTRRAEIEALAGRIDAKFSKITDTLSSVQTVAEESMRQVRASWGRIEEEGKLASNAREAHARLDEQFRSQKELLTDLKRTQELRLSDRRAGDRNA